ncbi:hypothetical protein D3C77_739190 [compost metagenome]
MEHSRHDGISIHLDRCYVEAKETLASLYPDKEGEVKKYTFVAILHIYNGIRTTVSKGQAAIEAKSAEEAEKRLRRIRTDRVRKSKGI